MVYTVTFNPALDYIVRVRDFRTGETNRTESDELQWGGKGINVSTVLRNLGVENAALGFLAGFTGRALDQGELELLQGLKTGALISAAAELGCIAAGGDPGQRVQVRAYAQALGRAFQVRDDMLDIVSLQEEIGKPVGSDQVNEKSTFVTALGLEGCAALVEQLTQRGIEALIGFDNSEFLIWLARSLAQRTK